METYRTAQCDTWDQIALKAYGSSSAVRDMLAENAIRNPYWLLAWRFPAGCAVRIPDLTPDTTSTAQLPVWRRPE